jgi:cyclopropane fatty-acyl-phospholipid synthase-like methyltransferase
MRITTIPANLVEALLIWFEVVPRPFFETQFAFTTARAIMAGSELGVFDTLAAGDLTVDEISGRCGSDPRATGLLLNALVGCRYLAYAKKTRRYGLSRVARRWLLKTSPQSLHDKMLFQRFEWDMMARLEEFVRHGRAIDAHSQQPDSEFWPSYQRAMRSLARMVVDEFAARTPVPSGASAMLDIGGSTGVFSSALCRNYPGLVSTILDLPQAVAHAAPLLAQEGLGDRVQHRAGNALTEELGEARYDLVLMANIAHHFSDEQNRDLTRKVTRALRPGGVFVVHEVIRAMEPRPGNQLGTTMGLWFGLTSQSACWSVEEIASWQRAAGLSVKAPTWFRKIPDVAQQAGVKPTA